MSPCAKQTGKDEISSEAAANSIQLKFRRFIFGDSPKVLENFTSEKSSFSSFFPHFPSMIDDIIIFISLFLLRTPMKLKTEAERVICILCVRVFRCGGSRR